MLEEGCFLVIDLTRVMNSQKMPYDYGSKSIICVYQKSYVDTDNIRKLPYSS